MQTKPRPKVLKLSEVRRHPELQPRVSIDAEIVDEYRDAIQSGAKFPAVVVVFDGMYYYLADGWHRYEAHSCAGVGEIDASVYEGTFRDAKLHALGSNANHGLRRTNEDKRRAVGMLLADAEWSQWSDREIARRCNVSAPFVGAIRVSHLKEFTDGTDDRVPDGETTHLKEFTDGRENPGGDVRTVRRNGTVYQQNTAKIGRNPITPAEQQDDTTSNNTHFRNDATEDSSSADQQAELDAYVNRLERDNEALRLENDSLRASDRGAEIQKLSQRLINAENKLSESIQAAQVREKSLRWFGSKFSELRTLLNVKHDRDVLARVRMLTETEK